MSWGTYRSEKYDDVGCVTATSHALKTHEPLVAGARRRELTDDPSLAALEWHRPLQLGAMRFVGK